MSTAAVAKSLGVSRRTLMRWVDQLNLQLDKNDLGHYQFSDEDIEKLKQIQNETNITSPQPKKQTRKALVLNKVSSHINTSKIDELTNRMEEMEQNIQRKADGVVSYQLLQHRREMEELIGTIKKLELRIEELEKTQKRPESPKDSVLVFDQSPVPKKTRRKNLISSILGF